MKNLLEIQSTFLRAIKNQNLFLKVFLDCSEYIEKEIEKNLIYKIYFFYKKRENLIKKIKFLEKKLNYLVPFIVKNKELLNEDIKKEIHQRICNIKKINKKDSSILSSIETKKEKMTKQLVLYVKNKSILSKFKSDAGLISGKKWDQKV